MIRFPVRLPNPTVFRSVRSPFRGISAKSGKSRSTPLLTTAELRGWFLLTVIMAAFPRPFIRFRTSKAPENATRLRTASEMDRRTIQTATSSTL